MKKGKTLMSIVAIIVFGYALSWIVTCGLIKLITICFGITFRWSIATGIWIIMCVVKLLFPSEKAKSR